MCVFETTAPTQLIVRIQLIHFEILHNRYRGDKSERKLASVRVGGGTLTTPLTVTVRF
jgi:hypothetical protein